MKTIAASPESITLQFNDHEATAIIQSILLCEYGFSLSKHIGPLRPTYLQHVSIPWILEVLSLAHSDEADFEERTELIRAPDGSVIITFNPAEWGACVFLLNMAIFGFIVSPNDLRASVGLELKEIQAVMEELHRELEPRVYQFTNRYRVAIRRATEPKKTWDALTDPPDSDEA